MLLRDWGKEKEREMGKERDKENRCTHTKKFTFIGLPQCTYICNSYEFFYPHMMAYIQTDVEHIVLGFINYG